MALTKEQVTEIVGTYGRDENDTGSPEVQIALLTTRIRELTEHMKVNTHDFSSQRGLLKLVGQRRRLMQYLKRTDLSRYRELIDDLEIRG